MRAALTKLYDYRANWLRTVIEKGQAQKIFRKDRTSKELALAVVALGLGSQLCARVSGDPEQVRELKNKL